MIAAYGIGDFVMWVLITLQRIIHINDVKDLPKIVKPNNTWCVENVWCEGIYDD